MLGGSFGQVCVDLYDELVWLEAGGDDRIEEDPTPSVKEGTIDTGKLLTTTTILHFKSFSFSLN